jgi:uncharacterized protein YggE
MEPVVRQIFYLTVLASLTLATPALAQVSGPPAASPGGGAPLLHLTETASVKVPPTLLVADLMATASAPAAVPAQRHVNDLMAQAKKLTEGTPGVTVSFLDYTASYVDAAQGQPARWIASQTLEIRGEAGETVLDLVGRLQAIGLAVGDLGWQVPAEQAEAARRDATIKALTALRQEAAAAAAVLGLQVAGYHSIDLSGGPMPMPMRASRMMAAAAGMPSPQATAQPQDITATVSAQVILRPAMGSEQQHQP